jgi:hypothetical protein
MLIVISYNQIYLKVYQLYQNLFDQAVHARRDDQYWHFLISLCFQFVIHKEALPLNLWVKREVEESFEQGIIVFTPRPPRVSNMRAFVVLVKPLEDSGVDKSPEPRCMLRLSGRTGDGGVGCVR